MSITLSNPETFSSYNVIVGTSGILASANYALIMGFNTPLLSGRCYFTVLIPTQLSYVSFIAGGGILESPTVQSSISGSSTILKLSNGCKSHHSTGGQITVLA